MHTHRTRIRSVVATAGVLAVAILAGCESTPATNSPSPVLPATSNTTGSGSTPASTSVSTATSVGLAPCHKADVDISVDPDSKGGAAGHQVTIFDVRNTSTATCSVDGFVSLRWYDGSAQQLTQTVTQETPSHPGFIFSNPPSSSLIALQPGSTAYFGYEVGSDFANCTPAATMRVTLPDDTDFLSIASPNPICTTMTVGITALSSSAP